MLDIGKNWVCFETIGDSPSVHREQGQRAFMQPILSISGSQDDYNVYSGKYKMMVKVTLLSGAPS